MITVILVFGFLGSLIYGSLRFISYVFKLNISNFLSYSLYTTFFLSLCILSGKEHEIANKDKEIESLASMLSKRTSNKKYEKLLEEYKLLDSNYQTCIKSDNNKLSSISENIPQNMLNESEITYSIFNNWGSATLYIIGTVIILGVSYYYLSNHTKYV